MQSVILSFRELCKFEHLRQQMHPIGQIQLHTLKNDLLLPEHAGC